MRSGAFVIGLVTAGLAANAIRLRRKLARLEVLPPASQAPTSKEYDLVTAEGVEVSEDVRRSATEHAHRNGLGVLDLVPADLPVEQAMDLARFLNIDAFRSSPLAQGRGAGHAIVVSAELLKRAGTEVRTGLHPGEMAEATLRLRQYASAADLVVAPVTARDRLDGLAGRRAWLTALSVSMRQSYAVPTVLTGSALGYGAVLVCVAVNPVLGLVPLGVYTAVPYLIFSGTGLRPGDLHRAALLRLVETPLSWWRTVRAPRDRWEQRRAKELDASRAWHEAELASGLERFFEVRREACPWCGSTALRRHLTVRDGVHMKPGRFTLERCVGCGHVFLNPGLSAAGLDFYYRDVYDGLGGPDMDNVLSGQRDTYLGRAELVREALVQARARPSQVEPATAQGMSPVQRTPPTRQAPPVRAVPQPGGSAAEGLPPRDGEEEPSGAAAQDGTTAVPENGTPLESDGQQDSAADRDAGAVRDRAAVRDGAPRDSDATQDGAADEHTAAPRGGAPSDGAPSDGAPSDGAAGDGAAGDGAAGDGAAGDGGAVYGGGPRDSDAMRGAGAWAGRPGAADPPRWLDVGTGSAHFPRMASEVFPGTEFHGLDMGSAVLEARRRGWIARAYRGLFPELADELAERYDVVSMNHYLEHTFDPQAELDAVAKALRPGGHVLIEVPDPESRFGRLLRSYWIAWLPPEHLNLVPVGNLERALEERGFEIVARVRREARQGPDIPHAAAAFLNTLWHPLDRPWTTRRPLPITAARRAAVIIGTIPIMTTSIVAELAVQPFIRDRSNAYRLVARKRTT